MRWVIWCVPAAGLALVGGTLAMLGTEAAGTLIQVSQRGREFQPGHLTIRRNDTVDIINDDGDFTHHAYVDSPVFKFDSADQQPGKSVQIHFNRAGEFHVLCGIHPKMRLTVLVK